ncbi:MAG: hypothetical protein RXQ95_04570 [Vulcanisaeta sp.]
MFLSNIIKSIRNGAKLFITNGHKRYSHTSPNNIPPTTPTHIEAILPNTIYVSLMPIT